MRPLTNMFRNYKNVVEVSAMLTNEMKNASGSTFWKALMRLFFITNTAQQRSTRCQEQVYKDKH